MEVFDNIYRIGSCDYFLKKNPARGEKYISVEDYNKPYREHPNNACKSISIYDEKEKVVLMFPSRKEAALKTGISRTTINGAVNSKKTVLVKKRYRFQKREEPIIERWEYSNKNYAG